MKMQKEMVVLAVNVLTLRFAESGVDTFSQEHITDEVFRIFPDVEGDEQMNG